MLSEQGGAFSLTRADFSFLTALQVWLTLPIYMGKRECVMPCLQADGTLSRIGVVVLQATRKPATPKEVAESAGLPLYRARSAIRGLVKAALLERTGESFVATRHGIKKLEAQEE